MTIHCIGNGPIVQVDVRDTVHVADLHIALARSVGRRDARLLVDARGATLEATPEQRQVFLSWIRVAMAKLGKGCVVWLAEDTDATGRACALTTELKKLTGDTDALEIFHHPAAALRRLTERHGAVSAPDDDIQLFSAL